MLSFLAATGFSVFYKVCGSFFETLQTDGFDFPTIFEK